MWVLTKECHLYDTSKIDISTISEDEIKCQEENLYRLISMFDFVYTRSEIKEDFGFVCEVTKDYFCVTFSKMNKKVTFNFDGDKKLRLIKEIWKPLNDKTYRKIWSEKDAKKER